MNHLSKIIGIIPYLFLLSCEPESNLAYNPELIFPYAIEISIPPYSYSDNTHTYFIKGDSAFLMDITDTISVNPTFKWKAKNKKLIFTAVFDSPIISNNNTILNAENMVWSWHSGLETGINGEVMLSEGVQVMEGKLTNMNATTLKAESFYYWGIWAWDDSGTRIKYSSRQITLYTVQP